MGLEIGTLAEPNPTKHSSVQAARPIRTDPTMVAKMLSLCCTGNNAIRSDGFKGLRDARAVKFAKLCARKSRIEWTGNLTQWHWEGKGAAEMPTCIAEHKF